MSGRVDQAALSDLSRCLCLIAAVAALCCASGCDRDTPPPTPSAGATADAAVRYQQKPTSSTRRGEFTALPPAPKPQGELPADATCVTAECHSSFAAARHVHQPVSRNECFTCHEHDTGGHAYPLARGGNDTCTFCHAVAGTETHQHAALKEGCITCHNPHASHSDFLLTELSVPLLCNKCHEIQQHQYSHRPFLEGQCSQCHNPHQSAYAGLLRGGEGNEHCLSCHTDMAAALHDSEHVHEPAAKNCLACHDAHSSDHEHHLRQSMDKTCAACHEDVGQQIATAKVPHEAVSTQQRCANCHDSHASDAPALRRDRDDRLCQQCHDSLQDRKFLHGPVKAGECAACHTPHGGEHGALLVRAFPTRFYMPFNVGQYDLCFMCHDQQLVLTASTHDLTGFRDGERNLHYLHVNRSDKGRTCRTCHDIHGSDLPNHMAGSVPFEGSSWSMPLKFQKTAEGGSCAPGCHEPASYSRTAAQAEGGAP